jgi:hypothetical protein
MKWQPAVLDYHLFLTVLQRLEVTYLTVPEKSND